VPNSSQARKPFGSGDIDAHPPRKESPGINRRQAIFGARLEVIGKAPLCLLRCKPSLTWNFSRFRNYGARRRFCVCGDMETKVESLKLLHDTSKWLAAIQSTICVALWPRLFEGGVIQVYLAFAWIGFAASALFAAALLLFVSSYISRLPNDEILKAKAINGLALCQYTCAIVAVALVIFHLTNKASRTETVVSDPLAAAAQQSQIKSQIEKFSVGEIAAYTDKAILRYLLGSASSISGGMSQESLHRAVTESRGIDRGIDIDVSLIGLIARDLVKSDHATERLPDGSERTTIVYRITDKGIAELMNDLFDTKEKQQSQSLYQ
jgi:hypothetical protein